MQSVQQIFSENEKPYDQKEHIRNEGKITGRKRSELGNEYRKPVIPPNVKLLANLKSRYPLP